MSRALGEPQNISFKTCLQAESEELLSFLTVPLAGSWCFSVVKQIASRPFIGGVVTHEMCGF